MKHLTILIKPSSSLCNMRCQYCFYHSLANERNIRSYGFMSDETAGNLINAAFSTADNVHFAFQGGEPTLAGLDFYQRFIAMVGLRNTGREFSFSIQTNGLVVSDEFAAFFAENRFLVGLSLDGTRNIHDFLRRDSKDRDTYGSVLKTARLFDRMGVEYNILIVLSAFVAKHIEKVYSSLKKQGFRYLQFIPCLDDLDKPSFGRTYSLTPPLYTESMQKLFRLYYEDYIRGDYVSIRYFENLISLLSGGIPEMCGMLGYCAGQFVVEGDGTVFPCDFYCTDHWALGNINKHSLIELYEGETMHRFIQSSIIKDEKCQSCPVFPLCHGGCRRNRDLSSNGYAGNNIYCDAIREFLTSIAPQLNTIAKAEQAAGVYARIKM